MTTSVKGGRLCQARPDRTIQVCTKVGGTPCDKGSASKWVLSPNSNGWQGLDGSHQWKMAETLFCLEKKSYMVVPFFCLKKKKKNFYVSFTFSFIPPSDYVIEEKVVTCFHEYVMKKYKY